MADNTTIQITRWKPMDKGSLKGFFEFEKGGFYFADCSYFVSDKGQKWVSLPSRDYTDAEGKKKYYRLCGFRDQAKHLAFCNKALEALEAHLKKPQPLDNLDQNMPF